MTRSGRTRVLGGLAALGLVALMTVTAAPALAVTCPTVDSMTGAVTPAPSAGADWTGCNLSNAFMPNADLAGASLQNADLSHASFSGADLAGADLSGATLTSVTAGGVNFSGADLSSAGLLGALLGGSNLRSANLDSANAVGTNFSGAALQGASLQGTDLDSAELGSANLFGATGTIASDASALWTHAICQNGASADYYTAGCFSAVAVMTPAATPTITSGTPGDNGWYTSGVTVSWYWVDSQSFDQANCPPTTSDATQGTAVTIGGSCTDSLGHTGTASSVVKIDTTPPAVTITGITNGARYLLGQAPTPQCTTSDSLSGVHLHAGELISGGRPDGSGLFTATCTGGRDNAGNVSVPVKEHYTVLYEFGGFLAPKVGATLKATVQTISVRFRLSDGNGKPIAAAEAADLAAHHDIRATLRGPGISPVVATCRWNSVSLYFGCPIPNPGHLEKGTSHKYTITVTENLGSGFVTAPPNAASENPETIHFE